VRLTIDTYSNRLYFRLKRDWGEKKNQFRFWQFNFHQLFRDKISTQTIHDEKYRSILCPPSKLTKSESRLIQSSTWDKI